MIIIAAFLIVAGTGLLILAGLGYFALHLEGDQYITLFIGLIVTLLTFGVLANMTYRLPGMNP